MWVGKTIFYFQDLPSVRFDNTVEMIAIEPEGKQRPHAYLPRAYAQTYPTAEDCPRADPKDLKRSILWAKQFSNMVECSLQVMNAKCDFECNEEGFVCEHCERLVRPACAGLVPGLEFLADTGSEEDLISKTDCRAHFPDVPIGPSSRPVSLITANGPVKGNQSVKLEVPEINSTLECYVLESTPPVCLVGRRCVDEGFDFSIGMLGRPHTSLRQKERSSTVNSEDECL